MPCAAPKISVAGLPDKSDYPWLIVVDHVRLILEIPVLFHNTIDFSELDKVVLLDPPQLAAYVARVIEIACLPCISIGVIPLDRRENRSHDFGTKCG